MSPCAKVKDVPKKRQLPTHGRERTEPQRTIPKLYLNVDIDSSGDSFDMSDHGAVQVQQQQ